MLLDKRNSKIPYIIAIVGSLILLVIYASSRTIGISSLGIEPVGLLDAIVTALQVIIIATSLYILITKIYPKGMTVVSRGKICWNKMCDGSRLSSNIRFIYFVWLLRI
ncbi:MAG: hypothetical protein E6K97_01870 [Thaumarchaeota archaeon]|nr:MAG: hypothetical protein E6K97_01870 [Nitrososphaerota archaeon]